MAPARPHRRPRAPGPRGFPGAAASVVAGILAAACGNDAGLDQPAPAEPPPDQELTEPQAPPSPAPDVLDDAAVQDDVYGVLSEDFQIPGLQMVTCPAHQPVELGHMFTCTATIDDEERPVPITVVGEQGRYTVGEPEDPE